MQVLPDGHFLQLVKQFEQLVPFRYLPSLQDLHSLSLLQVLHSALHAYIHVSAEEQVAHLVWSHAEHDLSEDLR